MAPYFQYPKIESQIYSSALEKQVCLFSWEHILFLLKSNVTETESISFEQIWNAPVRIARDTRIAFADRMKCHIPLIDKMVFSRINSSEDCFQKHIEECKSSIKDRSLSELDYLNTEKDQIRTLTHEQAISLLIKSKKIDERINSIENYIHSLGDES